jgi:hypothetical protein
MERNRSVLEVLKFLEVKDILTITSYVSQHWLRLSNSDEVWNQYCEVEGISAEDMQSCGNCSKFAYETLADLHLHTTVLAVSGQLKLFDCKVRHFLLTRPIKIPTNCSAVMVRNDIVFFTGGRDAYNRAFLYDFTKDMTEEYPNTLDNRRYHGSARIHRTVYLFGGDCGRCISAEKCSLLRKIWTWLPPMPLPHNAFTPCVRQKSIYLCGGSVSFSHVFHTATDTYEDLPFKLPDNCWCVAIFVQEDLVVESQYCRSKWNGTEGLNNYNVGRNVIP